MHDGVDRGSGTDGDAEHRNDSEGEAEVPAERAKGIADVGEQFLQAANPASLAHFLLYLFHAAQGQPGLALGRGTAGTRACLGLALEVEAELLVELTLGAITEEQGLEPLDQVACGSCARRREADLQDLVHRARCPLP